MDDDFLVTPAELELHYASPTGARRLGYTADQDFEDWRGRARARLADLLGIAGSGPGGIAELGEPRVDRLRERVSDGVRVSALVMTLDETISLPAYLLTPEHGPPPRREIMAIHGHGDVGPCIGTRDDYHHGFARELARAGATVLCPELRGFGALRDLSAQRDGHRLDYWVEHSAYSLATDAFLHGRTMIGDTVLDLLRWERWRDRDRECGGITVVGISYGGDLALTYPVFSTRVRRIFASGTLGSFEPIFSRCYNAPAHCIPGILQWMDRADIAGLNAPTPIVLHYGELDRPSPANRSASYNPTVPGSIDELRRIYAAVRADEQVTLAVTQGKGHEFDIPLLLAAISGPLS